MAKMVSFKVSFWTNNMKEDGGFIRKKAWDYGVVHLLKNVDHNIESDNEMFHHLSEVPTAIRKLAKRNEIELRPGRY